MNYYANNSTNLEVFGNTEITVMEKPIAMLLIIFEVSCVDISIRILVGAFSVHLFIHKVASVYIPIR